MHRRMTGCLREETNHRDTEAQRRQDRGERREQDKKAGRLLSALISSLSCLLCASVSLWLAPRVHSTVTLLARLRGLSTSQSLSSATWYASSCSGTTATSGCSQSDTSGT